MINSHQFQQAAKQFRAGRISLKEFTDLVIDGTPGKKPPQQAKSIETAIPGDSMVAEIQDFAQLAKRAAESHKGDFGRVVSIGGSVGMGGAISLTGLAALRSGSGLVKILVPEKIQASVAALSPCLMTVGCRTDGDCFHAESMDLLTEHAHWADVVALGPGMGRAESLRDIVSGLYAQVEQPMVVDADGINVLVDGQCDLSKHGGQRILTPHPGEFQRLADVPLTNRQQMEVSAKQMAGSFGVIVVLKGNRTYVTNGSRDYRNDTGNPGMATAGTGDVLTGIITSLVGQGLSAFDAAVLGVRIHGIAGDFAAESVGEPSLIATDLIEHLPVAFRKHACSSDVPIGFLTN